MATMAEITTDKRVDDLRVEMYRGFDQVDQRFAQVDRRFDRVETNIGELRADMKAGFDSLHKLMIGFFATTLGSIVAGIALFFVTYH